MMELLLDPFVLFSVGCIVTPLAMEGDFSQEAFAAYFLNKPMIAGLAALLLSVAWTKAGCTVNLSRGQRMTARWYLLNGVVIHFLLDGLVGAFKAHGPFAKQYGLLDRRYAAPLGQVDGSTVHILSLLELAVYAPLCVLVYRAYHQAKAYRDALELVVCVAQLYGTLVYTGQELLTGAPSIDIDWGLTFSLHHVVYFWFAVVFGNVLYIAVPLWLAARAFMRLSRSRGEQMESTRNGARKAPANGRKTK